MDFPAVHTLNGDPSAANHYCDPFTWQLCVHILQLFFVFGLKRRQWQYGHGNCSAPDTSYHEKQLPVGLKRKESWRFYESRSDARKYVSELLGSNTNIILSGIISGGSTVQFQVYFGNLKYKKSFFACFITDNVYWL